MVVPTGWKSKACIPLDIALATQCDLYSTCSRWEFALVVMQILGFALARQGF